MSARHDVDANSDGAAPIRIRRPQTSLLTLIVLVACCAVVFWAWRHLAENSNPLRLDALAIRQRAVNALHRGKPSERLAAIADLEGLDFKYGPTVVPVLIQALDDPDIVVRVGAVEALGLFVPGLVKSRSGASAVQAAATALIARLKAEEGSAREPMAVALGMIASSAADLGTNGETVRDATAALTERLEDRGPRVRAAAAPFLAKIALSGPASTGTPSVDRRAIMSRLSEMLRDRDANVRLAVINGLTSSPQASGPPEALAEAFRDESAENRAAAVSGLFFYQRRLDPWARVLLRLAEHDPSKQVRDGCFRTLRFAFQPPAVTSAIVPDLIANLRSDDLKMRNLAAGLLSGFHSDARAAIPELVRFLDEPFEPNEAKVWPPLAAPDLACEAAMALGQIAPGTVEAKQVVAALLKLARSGVRTRQASACWALSEFGPAAEEAVPVLIRLINGPVEDRDGDLQETAVVVLGNIAADTPSAAGAVAALLPLLRSRRAVLQLNAIRALQLFGRGAAPAVPTLRALEDDRDRDISAAASKALFIIE